MGLISGIAATRWPGGCVPYIYDTSVLNPDEITNIEDAVAQINATGFVRLIKRTVQSRYVKFVPDYQPLDGICWSSHTGMSGGRQEVRMDPGAGVGVIMHEICHALGVYHEHKRPDRDDFVRVNYRGMRSERRGDFDKVEPPAAITVGPYDLGSIMHYGPSLRASVDGNTPLITPLDPTVTIGQRRALSNGDIASLQALDAGNAMVVGLDAQGQISSIVQLYNWSTGWTIASPYAIGPAPFLFLLKTGDGRMHINDIGQNGAIGAIRDNRDWSSGWTTGLPYTRGPQASLLLYKAGSGLLRIHSLTANGTVGPMIEESQTGGSGVFGQGWTSVAHYTIGASDYLLFLRESTGEMQIIGVGWNGGLGQRIQWADWSSGWTTVRPFTTAGGNFLFLLKAATGQMHVNAIKSDGTIGPKVQEADWSSGWTMALPYQSGNQTFLFLIKSGTGDVHINRINADGTIGPITDRRLFAPGWTTAAVYKLATGTFLLLIKE